MSQSSSESSEDLDVEYNVNMIPVTVQKDSDNDISVEVKHKDSSVSEKIYETLMNKTDDITSEFEEISDEESIPDAKKFKEECIEELRNYESVSKLVDKLHKSNNLNDYMNLIRHLCSGSIGMDNIVFLLMLERAKFQTCSNTISMRYRRVTKLFWSIVYRLCKSSGLKFFSGEKNWGQVVDKTASKSHYKPNKSKINFAVPSEQRLRYLERVFSV